MASRVGAVNGMLGSYVTSSASLAAKRAVRDARRLRESAHEMIACQHHVGSGFNQRPFVNL